MSDLFNRLFDTTPYNRLSDINRARITYGTVLVFAVVYTLAVFAVPFQGPFETEGYMTIGQRLAQPALYPFYLVTTLVFYGLGLLTWVGVVAGRLNQVSLGPALMVFLGLGPIAVFNNVALSQNIMLVMLGVLAAALLDGRRGLLVSTPIYYIAMIAGYGAFVGQSSFNLLPNLLVMVFVSLAMSALLYLFLWVSRVSQTEAELDASQRRLQLAQLTTQITTTLAEVDDLEGELGRIVEEIRTNFPVAYHVQIFLIDETGRIARLAASTGEVGQRLLASGHALPVGSVSVIGQATQRQEAIISVVDPTDANSIHRPNDLLPETRLEAALPMLVGGRNLGALDLQSTDPKALGEDDVATLQAVANSIAVAIDNTRLIQQTQQRLDENQRLLSQMGDTQNEIERLNRELTRKMWADYLHKQQAAVNIDLDYESGGIASGDELSAAIMEAVKAQDVVRREENGQVIVAIPLRVRGEVIGAMEFEVENDLLPEDLEMLNEVGERLGLAAENNRLYEDSQRVAQREALVNQIGTRIQSANSVDATLSEAARSLRHALKARRVAIQLATDVPDSTGTASKQ